MSSEIDYEGELAVIIGTRCKEVAEQEALQYVAGYSIMNDVSARDVQLRTSQWTAGKARDIIATGTPSGVGFKRTPPLFLQDGDVVEVEIEGIGQLRNPIVGMQA